jgi:hypothetical protein
VPWAQRVAGSYPAAPTTFRIRRSPYRSHEDGDRGDAVLATLQLPARHPLHPAALLETLGAFAWSAFALSQDRRMAGSTGLEPS